ncbi:MAG: ferredoxin-type protein NapF [Thermodesulfobacteriota bacterium]
MVDDPSKREFLQNGRPSLIRPPWALPEDGFVASCTKCDLCLAACSPKIIDHDMVGYPKVNFSKGECSFCRQCLEKCPTQALTGELDTPPWSLKVEILSSCLVLQGTSCRSCGEYCPRGAISFQPAESGRSEVLIDQNNCTGCGACLGVCPAQCIRIEYAGNSVSS